MVTVDMVTYTENLETVTVPRHKREDLEAVLSPYELKLFRGICGKLQWLVAQVRLDLSYAVSTLQAELRSPTIGSLLRAIGVVRQAQLRKDFCLTFRPLDLQGAGVMTITDAALGNVAEDGSATEIAAKRVGSQSAYWVVLADEVLLSGKRG